MKKTTAILLWKCVEERASAMLGTLSVRGEIITDINDRSIGMNKRVAALMREWADALDEKDECAKKPENKS